MTDFTNREAGAPVTDAVGAELPVRDRAALGSTPLGHATNCGTLAPGKGYWLAGPLLDGGGNTAS